MSDRKLYSDEAAEFLGLGFSTWRRYCSTAGGRRRVAPPHDGTDNEAGHVRPWWWESTLVAWKQSRPGKGRRTDLLERRQSGQSDNVP